MAICKWTRCWTMPHHVVQSDAVSAAEKRVSFGCEFGTDPPKWAALCKWEHTKFSKSLQGHTLLRYSELDAHISDLERLVYELKYQFSLLAAMFISIWLLPPAPAGPPEIKITRRARKCFLMPNTGLKWSTHHPAPMLLRFLHAGLPMCDTIQQMRQ